MREPALDAVDAPVGEAWSESIPQNCAAMVNPTKAASISSDPMPKAYPRNLGTALVEPALPDVLAAAARIRPYLAPTPLRQSSAVSEIVGADVYLKHEFHLPTG